jgi:hypothetical protein
MMTRLVSIAVLVFAAAVCFAEPLEPSTYLADAPDSPKSAQAGEWVAGKNWVRLEEDDKTHAFKGEPVFFNDKVVAVFEGESAGIAVYSRQTEGGKLCARLQPICDGRADLKRTSVAIKENSRSSIVLEVGIESPDKEARRITYELTAGQPFIKTSAGKGVEKLRVHAPCRFAVMPDFSGDDIVDPDCAGGIA